MLALCEFNEPMVLLTSTHELVLVGRSGVVGPSCRFESGPSGPFSPWWEKFDCRKCEVQGAEANRNGLIISWLSWTNKVSNCPCSRDGAAVKPPTCPTARSSQNRLQRRFANGSLPTRFLKASIIVCSAPRGSLAGDQYTHSSNGDRGGSGLSKSLTA
jgi:hypothetical protein